MPRRADGLPEADGSDPGTGEASFAEEAEDPGGSPPAAAAAQGSESQAVIQTVSVVKSVGAMRSAVGGKSALRALEAKV